MRNQQIHPFVVVFVVMIIALACSAMTRNAARLPENLSAAAATGTAIAPLLEPTRAYNDNVMPAIRAVEKREAAETIERKAQNERLVADMGATVKVIILGTLGFVGLSLGLAVGALMLAFVLYAAVRYWKLAHAPQGQVVPGKGHEPVQFDGLVYDPRTGAAHSIAAPQPADSTHAWLLTGGDVLRIAARAAAVQERGPVNRVERRIVELAQQFAALPPPSYCK